MIEDTYDNLAIGRNEGGLSDLYARAIHYLLLSETRSTFDIEHEKPTATREKSFANVLIRAGEKPIITQDYLTRIQNAIITSPFSREATYRFRQNWLEDAAGMVSFLPHPPEGLLETMTGWESYVNAEQGIDLIAKIAGASFGLVYIHPFMDGNGRLHRFMLHDLLKRTGLQNNQAILPISATWLKTIPEYLDVLKGFSEPTTSLALHARG